jgi:hypothetical protein
MYEGMIRMDCSCHSFLHFLHSDIAPSFSLFTCLNQYSIRTLPSFFLWLLSESAFHSDSLLLFPAAPVSISSPFGLSPPIPPGSCLNQLSIRTLSSFFLWLLSQSPLHSDSLLLFHPAPVSISSPFGLSPPIPPGFCLNLLSIRTLSSYSTRLLSQSSLHSDSPSFFLQLLSESRTAFVLAP